MCNGNGSSLRCESPSISWPGSMSSSGSLPADSVAMDILDQQGKDVVEFRQLSRPLIANCLTDNMSLFCASVQLFPTCPNRTAAQALGLIKICFPDDYADVCNFLAGSRSEGVPDMVEHFVESDAWLHCHSLSLIVIRCMTSNVGIRNYSGWVIGAFRRKVEECNTQNEQGAQTQWHMSSATHSINPLKVLWSDCWLTSFPLPRPRKNRELNLPTRDLHWAGQRREKWSSAAATCNFHCP